jgi:hypothetical protein
MEIIRIRQISVVQILLKITNNDSFLKGNKKGLLPRRR